MPRGVPNKSTAELAGPKAPEVTMPKSGSFTCEDVPEVEVVADVMSDRKDWAENMAFANEKVAIRLHESNDPNDEPRVPVCVNGEKAHPVFGNHLPRGVEVVVKRYVVEALLRAKPINVKTVKTVDHDGNDTAKIVRSIGTKYPFEMVNPTAKDMDWLRRIRADV
jgi:hypothetical protein